MAFVALFLLVVFLFNSVSPMTSLEPVTCKDLLFVTPPLESGVYEIKLPSGKYKVYCEMSINGGGYTFISPSMLPQLKQEDMKHLFTNSFDVLLRIARPDGTQPYTIVSQFYDTGGLSVQLSSHVHHAAPLNTQLGAYIYLGTLPISEVQKRTDLGFMSNGNYVKYIACGKPDANFFAFYSNQHEHEMNGYLRDNPVFEHAGVAVDWRKTARRPNSGRRMPDEYFLFTEMHYGGCGCYTSSERWINATSPALGTAIGIL